MSRGGRGERRAAGASADWAEGGESAAAQIGLARARRGRAESDRRERSETSRAAVAAPAQARGANHPRPESAYNSEGGARGELHAGVQHGTGSGVNEQDDQHEHARPRAASEGGHNDADDASAVMDGGRTARCSTAEKKSSPRIAHTM